MKSQAISLLLALVATQGPAFAFPKNKPITLETGTPVPAKRIYRSELTTPSPERTAKISFLRDDGPVGGACNHKILVDDGAVFDISPGEYQTLYLAPGPHVFRIDKGDGRICPKSSKSMSATLADGAEASYRIATPPMGGPPLVTQVGESTGVAAVGHAKPAFDWDSHYSTPGTSLTLKEKSRAKSPRGTRVEYELTAEGFSPSTPSVLWWKRGTSYEQLKATIGDNGTVGVLGTQAFMIEGFVPGQSVDLALAAGDSRAQAKAIPFPISATQGGYRASVELMSDTGRLFQVTFGGFQPGEAVGITSEYKGERRTANAKAAESGEVVFFPAAFGPKDQGTATTAATGRNGAISIQYKVGKKALDTQ